MTRELRELDSHDGAAGQAVPAQASGPSYAMPIKVLSTVIVVAASGGLYVLSQDPSVTLPPAILGLFLCALLVIVTGWWNVISGRTSIDGTVIRQTGLGIKEIAIAGITGCQLIYLPGLAWLIAPRLIVRSGGLRVFTFHTADAEVRRAFERLVDPARR